MARQAIYKISPRAAWQEARRRGTYHGSADDVRDGFIHMSTAEQVAATLARHFVGQTDLVLAAVDAAMLGDAVRWERSRGGALFPHVYGPLPMSCVIAEYPLPLDAGGRHVVPKEIAAP